MFGKFAGKTSRKSPEQNAAVEKKDVETAHAEDEAAQAKEAELPRDAADAAAETDPGAAV